MKSRKTEHVFPTEIYAQLTHAQVREDAQGFGIIQLTLTRIPLQVSRARLEKTLFREERINR